MRNFGSLLILSWLLLVCLIFHYGYAQSEHRTIVRAGKHPNYIRVVFVSSAEVVKNASVMFHKENSIRVELKSSEELEVQHIGVLKNNTSVELLKGLTITAKDKIYYLHYDSIKDISVSKLSNPHRLVIDITIAEKKMTFEDVPQQKEDKASDIAVTAGKGNVETIIIDPGHGGDDRGIKCSKTTEKDLVLSISRELSNILNRKGKQSFLIRKQDIYMPLTERQAFVKGKRSDLLLSLHLSSTGDMVIYSLYKDKSMDKVLSDFYNSLKFASKGAVNIRVSKIVPSMFHEIKRPSLLIELPNPDNFNYDKKNRDTLITALTSAVTTVMVEPE